MVHCGLIIIGSGQFAEEVLNLANMVCVEEGVHLLHSPCLISDEFRAELAGLEGREFVVAIEDNAARADAYEAACGMGMVPATLIHPSAIISPSVRVGAGSIVMERAVLNAAAIVGRNCVIGVTATVDHECTLGDHAQLQTRAALGGAVRIDRLALIGMGSAVIPGKKVGEGAVVGPRAVVVRDVEAGAVVAGVPARRIR